MDEHYPPVSMGEYGAFYAIDRKLYSVLAIELLRDPGESVEVLALWIVFEQILGFKNFVSFMCSLHPSMVSKYADEAVACLGCIKEMPSLITFETRGIPLTFSLLKGRLSLQFLYENRYIMVRELQNIVSRVCAKALPDCVDYALGLRMRLAHDIWVQNMANFCFISDESGLAYNTWVQDMANLGFIGEEPGLAYDIWVQDMANLGFISEEESGSR